MAVTRVNSASISGSGTTTASATIPGGTGIQAGDLIVVSANCNGTHATNGMSVQDSVNATPFTTVKEQDLSGASSRWLQTFSFVTPVNIADGSTVTLTPYASSAACALAVDVFRGVTGTISRAATGTSPAAGTTSLGPALGSAPPAGDLVLSFNSFSTTTATLTVASPFTAGSQKLGVTPSVSVGYVLAADGSSTYAVTWTNDSSQSNADVAVSFAAVPAAAPASPALPGRTWLRRFHHQQQLPPPPLSQAVTVTAGLATGTGAAQGVLAAVGVNAAVATGTGAAQSPAVTTAASVTAVLATGTGTAQGAIPAVAVNATLASGAGTAQNATASTTASGTANAVLATGTGAALNATATAASAPGAVLATGTGAALGPVPAVGVNAGLASGTGAAGQPAITAAASVTAVLATGTGAAQNATASTTASGTANAVLATGAGAAQSPVTAIAVNAAAATGTGTAQAAGRAVTAGLATGTGAAQTAAAIVAAQAQAQAAHALAAALNATAAAVEPFTIGALTASDAPGAVLTAAGTASALTAGTAPLGVLGASDMRGTGIPGLIDEGTAAVLDEAGAFILAENGA